MIRSVEFDCVTLRERNQRFASRGGMMAAAARTAKQRATAKAKLLETFGAPPPLWITPPGAAPSLMDPNPITVRITRIGPGELDDDGPGDAAKNVRDGVADWLGVEDRQRARDRHFVDWQPAGQERVSAFTTAIPCKVCGAAVNAACRPGAVDLKTGAVAKMSTGIHIARRTPWRVRIEVEDRTPGADRRVVLASEPAPVKRAKTAKKRPKATPAGDPGEEVAARLLVPCRVCRAPVGARCSGVGTAVYGVHVERAQEAGMIGLGHRLTPTVAPAPRTGVRKMAPTVEQIEKWREQGRQAERRHLQKIGLVPPGQARLPLARCYALLPWRPREAIHEPRIDGLAPPPSLAYAVPAEHRATWGRTVTLYRQARTAAGLGTITVYALKGQQR